MPLGKVEQALPSIPNWVDENTYVHLLPPLLPIKAKPKLGLHTTFFHLEDARIGEQFLEAIPTNSIKIFPPDTPDETIDFAIQRTQSDEFVKRRNPLNHLIFAPLPRAEKLRTSFPELTILDPTQIDRLIKRDGITEKYGFRFPEGETGGMDYLGALIINCLIMGKARKRTGQLIHVNTDTDKVWPAAIKTAALMAQHADLIYVQKGYGAHPFTDSRVRALCKSNRLARELYDLDLELSGNFLASKALLEHIPTSTTQQKLFTLIAAKEYGAVLSKPLGLSIDTQEVLPEADPSEDDQIEDILEMCIILQEELYDRNILLIDAKAEDFQRINTRLRASPRSLRLGQLLPSLYTLMMEQDIDLDAVNTTENTLYTRRHAKLAGMGERRSSLGMRGIEMTTLPEEPRPNILGYPTYGRWATSLAAAVGTVVEALERDGVAQDSAIFIADGTPNLSLAERAQYLRRYFEMSGYVPPVPIYIFTQESQQALIDEVEIRTKLPRSIIASVIGGTSCGDNREKLAIATGAYVQGTNNQIIFGLIDDDLVLHRNYERARGFGDTPNSQVIINEGVNRLLFEWQANGSIKKDFLAIPGKTIAQLREHFPGMPAAHEMKDTMNRALDDAQNLGVSVLEVNPTGETIAEATVWGVSSIKYKRPDYRTIKVARDHELNEFPETELSMLSYPAGPNHPFAFRTTKTNVDLAFSAWAQNDTTRRLPYSFLVSRNISLQNQFKTVTTETRADNEQQPGMLEVINRQTGLSYAYVTGTALRAEHHREPSGYRPSMIEQACTSLVDNLYAQAANELIDYLSGQPIMDEKAIEEYNIPEERAKGVYRQLQDLAQIATHKIMELRERSTNSQEEEQVLISHVRRYEEIIASLRFKLGVASYEKESGKAAEISEWDNVAFDKWKEEIDRIGRKQLHYYNGDLKYRLRIMEAVQEIIREGKYPVAKVMLDSDSTISVPGQATSDVT